MTEFYLPESDRISEYVNPVLEQVAQMDPIMASAVEVGATTVIGLMGESLADLRAKSIEQARIAGLPVEAATQPFDVVAEALFDIAQPRLDALRGAVVTAQSAEAGDTEPEAEDTESEVTADDLAAIDDVIEGLFASLLGPEVAAQMRAAVEADDAAKAEGQAVEDEGDDAALEREVEDFLNSLFNRR